MKLFAIALLILMFLISGKADATPMDKSIMSIIVEKTPAAKLTNQIILVIDHNLSLWNKVDGRWTMELESYCGYGKNGFSNNRHEGDKTTPIGSFPLLYAFGLGDNPGTKMTYRKITPQSYLSGEEVTYNTWVESDRPLEGSEHLIDYYQYKYAINIGFNVNPTVFGRGAAIFLHCKSTDHWWTAGCVSVPEEVMLQLLQNTRDGAYIIITPSIEELTNF